MRARGKKKLPRTGGRVIKGRLWMVVAAVLLVAGMAGFAGRMQRAEQALLETGAVGWATRLLSESAAEGMEAVTGPLTKLGTDGEGNVTYLSVDRSSSTCCQPPLSAVPSRRSGKAGIRRKCRWAAYCRVSSFRGPGRW